MELRYFRTLLCSVLIIRSLRAWIRRQSHCPCRNDKAYRIKFVCFQSRSLSMYFRKIRKDLLLEFFMTCFCPEYFSLHFSAEVIFVISEASLFGCSRFSSNEEFTIWVSCISLVYPTGFEFKTSYINVF